VEIIETKKNDITVLALKGRLDTLSSTSLENKLLGIINNNVLNVIIDFSELEFISSSGLRVLLTAGKQVKTKQGMLVLCSLKEHVKEVFDVAGFTMLFKMYASLDEAIQKL